VARILREKPEPAQPVIDNDNMTQVMKDAESRRIAPTSLRYTIGDGGSFRVSSPDVSCSLAFTANAKALLSTQYTQMELPAEDLAKLSGPAHIDGDTLEISLFNGTEWHISEIAVALTLVSRGQAGASDNGDQAFVPLDPQAAFAMENRSLKKSDQAAFFRMRQATPPMETTVFRFPLSREISPDQEWHWAIVQARGYPPQASQPAVSSSALAAPTAQSPAAPQPMPSAASPVIPTSLTQEMSQ